MKDIRFLLDEASDFSTLVSVLEQVFKTALTLTNKDGRLIASGASEAYHIRLVDKYDDLSPILCDGYYSLVVSLPFDNNVSYQEVENRLSLFCEHDVRWIKETWSIDTIDQKPRILYFKS